MPCFDPQFQEAKGNPVDYNGFKLVRIDRFPVKNGDILTCSIEKSNDQHCLQGFCIDVTGSCELDGELFKIGKGIRMLFWSNTASKEIKLKVFTKKDHVVIYNICERETTYLVSDEAGNPIENHSKTIDYWIGGAAMVLEEIPHGKRYHCSDSSCEDKEDQFGDIVFTVQKLVLT